MSTPITEQLHQDAYGLDTKPLVEIAELLAQARAAASTAPMGALNEICAGATSMANTIRSVGVLRYLAAGSSGLMASANAVELDWTFSIPSAKTRIHMAGGLPTTAEMPGDV
ncbi:hypothetical protein [Ruegeria sp. ANG-S4]|uniref:hypothetical protein n=1 Tax=Ruegeria sp. ANG-S4 TaxID=1577904 RepID=UPI000A5E9EEC|nr:hypothetical protein [Ruegeria sp. ANG-S4]